LRPGRRVSTVVPVADAPDTVRDLEAALAALKRRADEMEALNEIARIVTSGAELRPTLRRLTDAMRRRFGWEFVAIVSIDREAGRFVCEALSTGAATDVFVGYSRPLGSGVVGRVAASGEAILLDDVTACPDYIETFPGARAELCLPVTWAGEVLALLNLESTRLAAFRDEVRLLETVSEQIAGAMHLHATNQRLVETNRALQETNRRLDEAHERIQRLVESSPEALEDVGAWARALAAEIARSLGVGEIGVFVSGEDEALAPIGESGTRPPSAEQLRSISSGGAHLPGSDDFVFVVEGMSGERLGAVVLPGHARRLDESERRLLSGFARQLGGAVEMRRMRRRLADAEARRARTRQEMQERGIATLQICPACGLCFDHQPVTCSEDGIKLHAPHVLPLRLVDRYRLTRKLGQGGMGTVFAADDTKLGREVAIKLIRPELVSQEEIRTRLAREASTLARVQHPGVVALYDSGDLDDGSVFLVMERLHGRDLAALLDAYGRGTPAQVASLVRQAGAALAAAHRAGVVHRDVKPHNLFLVPRAGGFDLKLFDFGLARPRAASRGLTQFGMAVGTPGYMSPEQARGEDVDARGDLYALAASVYEALTGWPVIPARDAATALASVLTVLPSPASDLLPELPGAVDRAFAAALRKDRDERPSDVVAWCDALAAALDRVPATSPGWRFDTPPADPKGLDTLILPGA